MHILNENLLSLGHGAVSGQIGAKIFMKSHFLFSFTYLKF